MLTYPPPLLNDEFKETLLRLFWLGDRWLLSERVYRFWQHKFHPIEDEQ